MRGGSSETVLKLLAVTPRRKPPSMPTVMIVTPVGKVPITSR
jgi:hypothetical protein